MGYVAAKGGFDAIQAAETLVRRRRIEGRSSWLELDQIIDRLRYSVDRVMGEGGLWEKYGAWLARMSALPSVAPTLPDKERYLQHVKKYAEGKARSKVGNAGRRGASAHDYDDKLDDADVPTKGGERVA